MMPEPEIASQLPSFKKPPVNEVVLGMQFSAPALGAVHVGAFYNRLKDRFPRIEQVPTIPIVFESFVPSPMTMMPLIPFSPPFPRQWFISEDDERVVQFQADRLLVNWREREGGGRYPRYSNVKGLFHDALAAFTELMVKDVRGAFTPNQCEVTYLNNIPLQSPEDWGYPGRWLGLWNDELDASEGVNFTTRHLLQSAGGEPYARLTTSLESGQAGNRPIFRLSLMVRGRPLHPNSGGVLDFFDAGRTAIVQRFAAITTESAHQQWGRER